MRIAIVDDNHTDRIFLREGLERILLKRNIENSEIHIFNSAEDILEYLKNEQETFFDLIFMDIYMEKLTGVDAAREIRKKDKKVKIVFITTSNEFASESYEVRAEDYLIKPYDKTRLENVMDRIFSEKKYGKILELKDGRKIIINSIVYIGKVARLIVDIQSRDQGDALQRAVDERKVILEVARCEHHEQDLHRQQRRRQRDAQGRSDAALSPLL